MNVLSPASCGRWPDALEKGAWQGFHLELPSQPPRKVCLFPLSPGFPQNGPLACFQDLRLRAAGAHDAFGPFSRDSRLASVVPHAEGQSRAVQAPLKRSLAGGRSVGRKSGGSFPSGKVPGAARPGARPHSLSPSRHSPQRLPGTQWVPCSNDAQ